MTELSRWFARSAAALLLAAASLSTAGDAEARAEGEFGYSRTRTFTGALRYLRVDLDYEITEKDPDAGYLLFRYSPAKDRVVRGSIEVVETKKVVRVVVQIPEMPSYHERVVLNGLRKKLQREYGNPAKRKPPRDKNDKDKSGDKGKKKPKKKPEKSKG